MINSSLHIDYKNSINYNINNLSKLEIFKIRLRVILALKNIEITDWSVNVLYWFIFFKELNKKYKNSAALEQDIATQLKRSDKYVRAYFNSVLIKKDLIKKDKDKNNKVNYTIEPWILQIYFNEELNFNININYNNFDK